MKELSLWELLVDKFQKFANRGMTYCLLSKMCSSWGHLFVLAREPIKWRGSGIYRERWVSHLLVPSHWWYQIPSRQHIASTSFKILLLFNDYPPRKVTVVTIVPIWASHSSLLLTWLSRIGCFGNMSPGCLIRVSISWTQDWWEVQYSFRLRSCSNLISVGSKNILFGRETIRPLSVSV